MSNTNTKPAPAAIPADATHAQVIDLVCDGKITREQAQEWMEAQKRTARKLSLKIARKGGISLYGVRRFPLTFYGDEWEAIIGHVAEIREFLDKHRAEVANGKEDARFSNLGENQVAQHLAGKAYAAQPKDE